MYNKPQISQIAQIAVAKATIFLDLTDGYAQQSAAQGAIIKIKSK